MEEKKKVSNFNSNNFKNIILEKYGVENPSQSKELQAKRTESMRKMYESKGIKMKKYNYEYLTEFCEENKIKLSKDYSQEKLNKDYVIDAKCNSCDEGVINKKMYYFLFIPLCTKCTAKKRLITLEENNLKKYGVKNVFELKEIKEKLKETNLKKFGVENPSQNKDVQLKKEETSMKNYGTKSPMQNKQVINNLKEIFKSKYGVENPSQVPEVAEKQNKRGFQIKEYTFPKGKKVTYQGYEHFVLDLLINENKLDEDDIETAKANVPELWYNFEGIKRRHFVDIYIKSKKTCIEVKSTWTLKKHYNKVFAKQECAKKDGYKYIIIVVSQKGEIIEQYK